MSDEDKPGSMSDDSGWSKLPVGKPGQVVNETFDGWVDTVACGVRRDRSQDQGADVKNLIVLRRIGQPVEDGSVFTKVQAEHMVEHLLMTIKRHPNPPEIQIISAGYVLLKAKYVDARIDDDCVVIELTESTAPVEDW